MHSPLAFSPAAEHPNRALIDLSNISFVLAENLAKVEVATPAQLRRVGAEEAWLRLRHARLHDGFQVLLALEGAITGTAWQSIPVLRRRQLVHFAASFA